MKGDLDTRTFLIMFFVITNEENIEASDTNIATISSYETIKGINKRY